MCTDYVIMDMVEIRHIQENDYEIIEVAGEVDASSSITLDNAIHEALDSGRKHFLIDCTALDYISSAGLGVFMSYIETIKKEDITLVIFGLKDKVANVFEILGLDQLLVIKKTKEEAKALLV